METMTTKDKSTLSFGLFIITIILVAMMYGMCSAQDNIILVILDTVSAEYVKPNTAPNLKALEKDCKFQDEGMVTNKCTTVSIADMLTYKGDNGMICSDFTPNVNGVVYVPQHLKTLNYDTFGVVSTVMLEDFFMCGFDDWDVIDDTTEGGDWGGESSKVTDRFLTMLNHRISVGITPFFGMVHYYEPHSPYICDNSEGMTQEERYIEEIRSVDVEIGRLVNYLKQVNAYENTNIIVTNDHGEDPTDTDESWGNNKHWDFNKKTVNQCYTMIKYRDGKNKSIDKKEFSTSNLPNIIVGIAEGE
jgi:membrane-anchored protein YejM (alkaline phosphatase superfamily)